jgi:quercetin dioxygenase-like cupin family protein
MHETHAGEGWFPIAPGIMRRTTAAGAAMMQMVVTLEAGAHLPLHQHPNEQLTYLLRGRLRLVVGGVAHELGAGDALLIPGGVPHSADVLEEALALDTFSPPREDLLAQDRAATAR